MLDNLSVHTCEFTQHRMSHHDFKWAFNAPYFLDGNAIEFVFSIVKREFKKKKLQMIMAGRNILMNKLI